MSGNVWEWCCGDGNRGGRDEGLFWLATPILRSLVKKSIKQDYATLKTLLESSE